MNEINIIRFSYGLNGLLLQCRDIPLFVEQGKKFYGTFTDAVDIWLGRLTTYERDAYQTAWTKHRNRSVYHLTYRYNLLHHIGQVSTLDHGEKIAPYCYDPIYMSSIYEQEHFNPITCENSDWTPCNNTDVKLIEPISITDRSVKLPTDVKIEVGELGMNCDRVCGAKYLKCAAKYFPIINNCAWLSAQHRCDKCTMSAGRDQPAYAHKPNDGGWQCYKNAWEFSFNCVHSHAESHRLCPCAPY